MKVLIVPLLIFALPLTAYTQVSDFEGSWKFKSPAIAFDLNLSQSGTEISGQHCSTMQNGNKIDCSDEDEKSVSGNANASDSVIIAFRSFFSSTMGTAVLRKVNSRTLEWKILSRPDGEFYLPLQVLLVKEAK